MHLNKGTIHYLLAGAVFFLLKGWHSFMDTSALVFLLKPTNALVEAATASQSVYIEDTGYYHESLDIVINKSCSGFNFMLICFAVLVYLALRHIKRDMWRLAAIPITLAVAYMLTIFVNSARIVSAIYLGRLYPEVKNTAWAHEALGAFIYLSFLILFYLLASVIVSKPTRHNAKPA